MVNTDPANSLTLSKAMVHALLVGKPKSKALAADAMLSSDGDRLTFDARKWPAVIRSVNESQTNRRCCDDDED